MYAYYDDDEVDTRKDIVIDNGTGMIKAGYSGDSAPKAHFRSCIGYTKEDAPAEILGMPQKPEYIGPPETIEGYIKLVYPLAHGMVEEWDDMQKIWDHTFNELESTVGEDDSADNTVEGVFMTEAARNPKSSRERTTALMFEKYNLDKFYLGTQAVLALYASGRLTGVAVDIGAGVTHTVPIYEGYTMPHAIHRSNIAGKDLTAYLVRCLQYRGVYFTSSAETEIARRIKEDLCYVALDYDEEVDRYENGELAGKTYYMPDGQDVELKEIMCRVPEYLFNSMKLENVENQQLHKLTWDTIMSCDMDVRKDLEGNITLSGGTTMIPGLAERLQKEVQALAPLNAQVRVVDPDERMFAVWIGGSILASLSTFEQNWMRKKSDPHAFPPVTGYDEIGPRLVHVMCSM